MVDDEKIEELEEDHFEDPHDMDTARELSDALLEQDEDEW